jgi:hypothetical protein
MIDLSDIAKANAISMEIKKDGLTQRQNGDWQLRFTVDANDMNDHLARAAMGTRYFCFLVEKNDDETPVDRKAKERDKWRDLGAQRQAGMRCKEPTFWAYLSEEMFGGAVRITNEESAARVVREHCGVASRADLMKPGNADARTRWHQLDHKYQAWKAMENA